MDMEKIIIRCGAEHLRYEFPKRKWYQLRKYNRIALMRLAFCEEDTLETDIRLELYEEFTEDALDIWVDPDFKQMLYRAVLRQYQTDYANKEHLIVLDETDNILPEMVYELAANCNYLSIMTEHPEKFEEVMDRLEEEYGLVAMLFESVKELIRYIKQITGKRSTLLLAGEEWHRNLLYQLPEKSFFVDFSLAGIYHELILRKRMKFTYVSIPIFLDNIVKNRYNAVVNEGITFQVKQDKKTVWRRKGNEDGRKEKYPDL